MNEKFALEVAEVIYITFHIESQFRVNISSCLLDKSFQSIEMIYKFGVIVSKLQY